jgi:putative ABC transport system permease protein
VYMGAGFNFYTGVSTPVLQYFAISFALFFGVYVVYFGATYVGFIRNIEE